MNDIKRITRLCTYSSFAIDEVPLELKSRIRWLIARYSDAIRLRDDSKKEVIARRKRWGRFWKTITKVERSIVRALYIGGSFTAGDISKPSWRYSDPNASEHALLSRLQRNIALHYLPGGDLWHLLYICQNSNPSLPKLSIEMLTYVCDVYAGTLGQTSNSVFDEDGMLPVLLPSTLQIWHPIIRSVIRTTIQGRAQAAKRNICVTWPPYSLVYVDGAIQQIELQEDLSLGLHASLVMAKPLMLQ